MNSVTGFKKTAMRSAVLFALTSLGTGIAHAASEVCATPNLAGNTLAVSTDHANFSMLTAGGGTVGGTNNVAMTWDGTAYNNNTDYTGPGSAANVTAASTTPFFNTGPAGIWTAHDIQVFLPGSYSFDVTLGGGNAESGTMNVTVPAGMLGMHMLFDWNGNLNIDVFVVVAPDSVFGAGLVRSTQTGLTPSSGAYNKCDAGEVINCLYDGPTVVPGFKPTTNQVWMLASTDGNGGGVMGIPMATGGPFAGFNANFNFPGVFADLDLQNTCAGFVDTSIDPISFTAVTNATAITLYESNTVTISGLGVSQPAPDPTQTASVTITDGEYSKNGGAYTSAPGTASNNDTFKVRGTSPAADGLTTRVVLDIGGISSTFSISTPAIVTAQGSNFTMLDPSGGIVGGTNDVVATWDGTSDTVVASMNFSRMSLSTTTPFFSYPWTAHHIRVFGPGTYRIDTTCTIAQLEAGTSACNNPLQGTPGGSLGSLQTQQYYDFTVGAGQIGVHMLFDWNNATNIDVVDIMNLDQAFGPSSMYTGASSCNNSATLWDLMSTDWDGDGQNGAAMVDGPFQGFKANFNIRLPGSPFLECNADTSAVNVDDPTGATGCSISPGPVNVLQRADWWLVAGFLAWLGAVRMRFKRQTQS